MTTLTKRMAEDLTKYLDEAGVKVRYLHSDVKTLERMAIVRDLRLGVFDVLVDVYKRQAMRCQTCNMASVERKKVPLSELLSRASRLVLPATPVKN